jgi:predicted transcriptional regulator
MEITIRLPVEHFDRLSQQALEGSPAKSALSRVADRTKGAGTPQAVRTIVCDLQTAEALQRLASVCCTPALPVILEAIQHSEAR